MSTQVIVEQVKPVKPGLIRVSLYTVMQSEDTIENKVIDYEIVLATQEFITQKENSVEINVGALQHLLTKHIVELQDTANIAAALQAGDIHWELVSQPEEPITRDGRTLAHGETKE